MTLTVGIDARAAAEVPAGRGRYVRELLTALNGLDDAQDVGIESRGGRQPGVLGVRCRRNQHVAQRKWERAQRLGAHRESSRVHEFGIR